MMDVSKISFILLLVAWSVQGDAEGLASKTGGQEPETRVVGGKDATEEFLPHQVALKLIKQNKFFFCGAAIISNRWLLTAAHCGKSRKPSEVIALVGTLSRCKGGTTYEISRINSHKQHNKPYRFRNDIAVISTKKKIEFNKKVQPLPLPTEDIKSGLSCLLSGWGKLSDAGGSLVCNGTSAGIVSFNSPCSNNIPDAYTNTYKYISWIEENTKSP